MGVAKPSLVHVRMSVQKMSPIAPPPYLQAEDCSLQTIPTEISQTHRLVPLCTMAMLPHSTIYNKHAELPGAGVRAVCIHFLFFPVCVSYHFFILSLLHLDRY